MNTTVKNISNKNILAFCEHIFGAVVGAMIILGQFSKSLDKDFWMYLVIFTVLFSNGFEYSDETIKKRNGRKAAIISVIATVLSIALYIAFRGIWVMNAGCWSLFIGVATFSLNSALILFYIRSNRQ
ncbi:MAG: hypothetical protein J6O17_05045 [Eubacterium sp.]|nr:hypothetical protein [Eubacterium sp.]